MPVIIHNHIEKSCFYGLVSPAFDTRTTIIYDANTYVQNLMIVC